MKNIIKTPVQEFAPNFIANLKEALLAAKANHSVPYYAAFDADGTLWNMDMGESFFDYQLNHCDLPNLPEDPWKYYLDLKAQGEFQKAYLWLAQINQGYSIEQVRDWAQEFFATLPEFPVYLSQRQLVEFLNQEGFRVFVVTASVKWSVEPAAAALGIPPSHVIGVTTRLQASAQGKILVTDIQDGPVTYRQGKVEALLQATGGVPPIFASGNTTGDLPLLESAQAVRLAIGSQPPGTELYTSEHELRQIALKNQWFTHNFF